MLVPTAGRRPRVVWGHIGAGLLWVVSAEVSTVAARAGHRVGVDSGGTLLLPGGSTVPARTPSAP